MSGFVFPVEQFGRCHETVAVNRKLAIGVGVSINGIPVQQHRSTHIQYTYICNRKQHLHVTNAEEVADLNLWSDKNLPRQNIPIKIVV